MNRLIKNGIAQIQLLVVATNQVVISNLLRSHTPLQRIALLEGAASTLLRQSQAVKPGTPITVALQYGMGTIELTYPLTLNSILVGEHDNSATQSALISVIGRNKTTSLPVKQLTEGTVYTTPFHSMLQHAIMKELATRIKQTDASASYKRQAQEVLDTYDERVEEYKAIDPTIWLIPELKIHVEGASIYLVQPDFAKSSHFSDVFEVVDYTSMPVARRLESTALKNQGFDMFSRIKGQRATSQQILATLTNQKATDFARETGKVIKITESTHSVVTSTKLKTLMSELPTYLNVIGDFLHHQTYHRALSGAASRAAFNEKFRAEIAKRSSSSAIGNVGLLRFATRLAAIWTIPEALVKTLAFEVGFAMGAIEPIWTESEGATKDDATNILANGITPLHWPSDLRSKLKADGKTIKYKIGARELTLEFDHPEFDSLGGPTLYTTHLAKAQDCIASLRNAVVLWSAWLKDHSPSSTVASLTGTIQVPVTVGAAPNLLPGYVLPASLRLAVDVDL